MQIKYVLDRNKKNFIFAHLYTFTAGREMQYVECDMNRWSFPEAIVLTERGRESIDIETTSYHEVRSTKSYSHTVWLGFDNGIERAMRFDNIIDVRAGQHAILAAYDGKVVYMYIKESDNAFVYDERSVNVAPGPVYKLLHYLYKFRLDLTVTPFGRALSD